MARTPSPASRAAGGAKFSEAINSILSCWRSSSLFSSAAISGSACFNDASQGLAGLPSLNTCLPLLLPVIAPLAHVTGLVHHVYSALMPATFEILIQPCRQGIKGSTFTQNTCTKTNHITIIVTASHLCLIAHGDGNRSDSLELVGHDSHTQTRATNEAVSYTHLRA